ncbi:MAG TPA: hypothetical protein VMR52_12325 [Dehalococcoidia bacterium]|nr:hypothetical protein [Dehalococcoidia bacterium]
MGVAALDLVAALADDLDTERRVIGAGDVDAGTRGEEDGAVEDGHIAAAEDDGRVLGVAVDVRPGEDAVGGWREVQVLAADADFAVADDGDVEGIGEATDVRGPHAYLACAATDDLTVVAGGLDVVVVRRGQGADVARFTREHLGDVVAERDAVGVEEGGEVAGPVVLLAGSASGDAGS